MLVRKPDMILEAFVAFCQRRLLDMPKGCIMSGSAYAHRCPGFAYLVKPSYVIIRNLADILEHSPVCSWLGLLHNLHKPQQSLRKGCIVALLGCLQWPELSATQVLL